MKIPNVQNLIGNTPLVFLEKYKNAEIWVKLEGTNLTGSLKDRTAQRLIQELEKRGELSNGERILAPSSGSFAVAMAMQAQLRGHKSTVVVNNKISGGNLKILERLGAEIIKHGKVTRDSMDHCKELLHTYPNTYAFADQLNDPAAVEAHHDTTGPEIINDMPNVTAVIASMGSGATLLGIASFLREQGHNHIDVFASIGIPGDRKKITGTYSPDTDYESPFIKELKSEQYIKEYIPVSFAEAKEHSSVTLPRKGLFVGQQTGGVYSAARKAIDTYNIAGPVVIVSGDTGFKWLPIDTDSIRSLRLKTRVIKFFKSLFVPMGIVPNSDTNKTHKR